jgi:hypothetical protein
LPISLGGWGGALAVTVTGSSIVGIIAAPIIAGGVVYWVEENKKAWETMEKDKKNDNEEIYSQEERK